MVDYQVTVPPNSTASLTIGAKDLISSDGIDFLEQKEGLFNAQLQSGNYNFKIKQK